MDCDDEDIMEDANQEAIQRMNFNCDTIKKFKMRNDGDSQ